MSAVFCYERCDGIRATLAIAASYYTATVFFLFLQISAHRLRSATIVRDASYVLVWEREHLWKQVVLVEVLQVVDLVERSLVLMGYILYLVQYLLIVDKACPKFAKVVIIVLKNGSLVGEIHLSTCIL